MQAKRDDPSEKSDDLSPEWTEYETAWAVDVADFGGPIEAARFLSGRARLFKEAQSNGITKEMLTGFRPNKPGFAERVADAFDTIANTARHAAE
jgi:hypothetical protein